MSAAMASNRPLDTPGMLLEDVRSEELPDHPAHGRVGSGSAGRAARWYRSALPLPFAALVAANEVRSTRSTRLLGTPGRPSENRTRTPWLLDDGMSRCELTDCVKRVPVASDDCFEPKPETAERPPAASPRESNLPIDGMARAEPTMGAPAGFFVATGCPAGAPLKWLTTGIDPTCPL